MGAAPMVGWMAGYPSPVIIGFCVAGATERGIIGAKHLLVIGL